MLACKQHTWQASYASVSPGPHPTLALDTIVRPPAVPSRPPRMCRAGAGTPTRSPRECSGGRPSPAPLSIPHRHRPPNMTEGSTYTMYTMRSPGRLTATAKAVMASSCPRSTFCGHRLFCGGPGASIAKHRQHRHPQCTAAAPHAHSTHRDSPVREHKHRDVTAIPAVPYTACATLLLHPPPAPSTPSRASPTYCPMCYAPAAPDPPARGTPPGPVAHLLPNDYRAARHREHAAGVLGVGTHGSAQVPTAGTSGHSVRWCWWGRAGWAGGASYRPSACTMCKAGALAGRAGGIHINQVPQLPLLVALVMSQV